MNKTQRPITFILDGKYLQDELKRGVDTLEMAVGTTLGARGLAVGIDRGYENVIIRDGVSVAKSIFPQDKGEAFAVDVMRESAKKTVMEVGDGTTATVILAHALYSQAQKVIATGTHPRSLVEEIETDIKRATELLELQAIPVKTLEQKIQVATISCEEESLGKLIGETIHEIGEDGVITVEHSKNGETYVDMQEGMQWDRGLASPYLLTNPDTMTGDIEDGYIFVTDFEINNMTQLMPLIQDFLQHGRFLTIIAPEFGGDALTSLIANKVQNKFLTLCIKAPSFGSHQTNMLTDIATLTGATFISKDQGHKLDDVRFNHLGKASKISASTTMTILSGGDGDKETIKARVNEVRKLVEGEKNDFELERLRERLAKLTNGVAVIRVGGATDIEIKERYERALDAALATRQAVKKGVIAGGEVAYLGLINDMKSSLVKKSLEAPFRRLMTNAGFDSGQMLERLMKEGSGDGVDVTDGEIKNMVKIGIIDPVAVPLSALKNASSVAIQLMSMKVLVLQEDTEAKK